MRFRLRTLMIVLALGPPVLAGAWFTVKRYRAWQQRDTWEDVGGPGAISSFSISCTLYAEETVEDEQVSPADDSRD